ncbi:MAG: type IV toxin-antitoxin system AbiEi family antitoxin [Pyrinomonadaceae bacterium]
MSTGTPTKINQLLESNPSGVVLQSSWLSKKGYSHDLQKRYRNSKWLESIGTGAMKRIGDEITYAGAIYSLQEQSSLSVHPGGRTALSLLGKAHYLEMATKRVMVFGGKDEKLPTWFVKYDWGVTVDYYQSSFLPPDVGMSKADLTNFSIKVSGPARSILECLYLAPERQDLMECYELMEGLNNLRPDQVQSLLEECQSIKVKRLFLYMAEKAGHRWFLSLNPDKIGLGHGKRSVVKDGVYVDKYQITVPRELEKNGKSSI